jgi:hypothetical protein
MSHLTVACHNGGLARASFAVLAATSGAGRCRYDRGRPGTGLRRGGGPGSTSSHRASRSASRASRCSRAARGSRTARRAGAPGGGAIPASTREAPAPSTHRTGEPRSALASNHRPPVSRTRGKHASIAGPARSAKWGEHSTVAPSIAVTSPSSRAVSAQRVDLGRPPPFEKGPPCIMRPPDLTQRNRRATGLPFVRRPSAGGALGGAPIWAAKCRSCGARLRSILVSQRRDMSHRSHEGCDVVRASPLPSHCVTPGGNSVVAPPVKLARSLQRGRAHNEARAVRGSPVFAQFKAIEGFEGTAARPAGWMWKRGVLRVLQSLRRGEKAPQTLQTDALSCHGERCPASGGAHA